MSKKAAEKKPDKVSLHYFVLTKSKIFFDLSQKK